MVSERCVIIFSGRVQGVGFRLTAVQFARHRPLGGTVRNLPDGRVELVLEGDSAEIRGLLADIRRHFEGFIHDVTHSTENPVGLAPPVRIVY